MNRSEDEVMARSFIVTLRICKVGNDLRPPGMPAPEARTWRRGYRDVEQGRLLVLSPEACAELLRFGLEHDRALAAAIVRAAVKADPALAAEIMCIAVANPAAAAAIYDALEAEGARRAAAAEARQHDAGKPRR